MPVNLAHLSLESMLGVPQERTFKFWTTVYGDCISVMIDSGASHNFICPEIIAHLKISLQSTKPFGVILGNGSITRGQGLCGNIVLQFQGISMTVDFLPFPLGSLDTILGMEWLQSLGWSAAHYRMYILAFWDGQQIQTIKGSPSLHEDCNQHLSTTDVIPVRHRQVMQLLEQTQTAS